jgi:hypothetical protein
MNKEPKETKSINDYINELQELKNKEIKILDIIFEDAWSTYGELPNILKLEIDGKIKYLKAVPKGYDGGTMLALVDDKDELV